MEDIQERSECISINQSRLMRLEMHVDLRSLLTQLQPGPYNIEAN